MPNNQVAEAVAEVESEQQPVVEAPPVPVRFDREQAFILYATFCGDVERTAHALNVRPLDVLRVAEDEGWNTKLAAIIQLKKSNKPGDVERAINRALNFAQAHRFRLFLERVVAKFFNMTPEEMDESLWAVSANKNGESRRLNTRALADLSAALEKCHAMCYLALNDTAQERVKRNDVVQSETAGAELHVQIANALAEVRGSKSARAMLFDAQLELANKTSEEAKKKAPVVNDDHEGEDS